MKVKRLRHVASASLALLALAASGGVLAQASEMTFFVSSAGAGKDADFGGQEARCVQSAVGRVQEERALLSTDCFFVPPYERQIGRVSC